MTTYYLGTSQSIENFRDTTKRQTMLGAAIQPRLEKCSRCGNRRTAVTGKQTQAGFVCHGCGKGKG